MHLIAEFEKCLSEAKTDAVAGIAIFEMVHNGPFNAYGSRIQAGAKITCHSHAVGAEWYTILKGEGQIFLADADPVSGELSNHRSACVSRGSVFCIDAGTAHQLKATTELDLIFFCPRSHLGDDRTVRENLV